MYNIYSRANLWDSAETSFSCELNIHEQEGGSYGYLSAGNWVGIYHSHMVSVTF
jgi:hypothetical protein